MFILADSAGHNFSLAMRQLIGVGTPRAALAGGYSGIFVLLAPIGTMAITQGGSEGSRTVFAIAVLIWPTLLIWK